ncbi:hypothetical protein GGQ85_002640 [Nitrobacter vulgaris]|nr:hypothetical protein [Nitrobacter vulgaris]
MTEGKRAQGKNWTHSRWSADQMEGLARLYPYATNTGILTGEVVAIDVDTPDPGVADAINAMIAELPAATDAPYRIGKAPKRCYLFRTTSPRAKSATGAYIINGHKCQVEAMGTGQQVVAFGTHPETLRDYVWFNGSPAETAVSHLPEIDHAEVDALARAEAYFAKRGELVKPASKSHANDNERTSGCSDHPWSLLNQRAYDNLDAWVPQLGLEGLRRYRNGYHSIASFRPTNSTTAKKRGRALNIQSIGIVDYADNNTGYSPIDLVAVCLRLQDHQAVDWLKERVGEPDDGTRPVNVDGLLRKSQDTPLAANDDAPKPRFNLTWFDDIEAEKPKAWVIKNVLGEGEHTTISGLPGTGKSVAATDIGCHVASGIDWFGRKVTQGLVLYIAAERKALTERRMMAFRKHHGVTDVPLLVLGGRLDLTSSLVDAKALAAVVKQAEWDCGHRCVLIVIDTLTRVFGGGDQNTSKDMGRFIQACDELIRLTGAHVTVLHHTAWSGERGKGAIDLDGAVDASFLVVKNAGTYTLKCDGTNDGDEGTIATFTMQSVELAKDEDGEPTTAPVIVPGESVATKLVSKGHAKDVLAALRTAVEEDGVEAEGPDFPTRTMVVKERQWRGAYYEAAASTATGTLQKRFVRAKADLIAKGQVNQIGQWFWAA